jgi:tripartite ATP-independent transporter DctP family solute receptor
LATKKALKNKNLWNVILLFTRQKGGFIMKKNTMKMFTAIVFVLVFCTSVMAADPINIKIAVMPNPPHPYAVSALDFKEKIEKATNGEITASVHAGGQLGGEFEYVQGLQLGTIDACMTATPSFAGMVPEYEIFTLPFLFKDYAHADRVFFESKIGDEAAAILGKSGIVLLSWHESGMQGFYNSKRPIKTIEDIKGMTMRTMESPTIAAAMNAYGARSIPMAFPEFYSAMQTGVVDGGENGIYAYMVGKHYEVAPYYSVSNHRYLTSAFLISAKTWQKIPEKYRDLVKKTAVESSLYGIQQGRKTEDIRYKEVVEKYGTKLNIVTDEAKAGFRKSVEGLYQEVGKKTGMQEMLDKIISLRDK